MEELSLNELEKQLDTVILGRNTVLLDAVDSTNAEARRLLDAGCADGTVVIAGTQTAGRGRRGRAWVSRAGCGLWMTAVVQAFMPVEEMQKLTLLAGLAVCLAVERCTNDALRPAIKWPNDVLAGSRKLCGILSESANDSSGARRAIVGIGVNTRRPAQGYGGAEGRAISIAEAANRDVHRVKLAATILNNMETLLGLWQREDFSPVAALYREYMLPPGSEVIMIDGERRRPGVIEGIDDGGGLLVRLQGSGVERIISGEITLRGTDGYV
jgi:BirA family transcriptional regulator, biotin operon repressor / biotin---[acetyl-CoA-carboxylase] ligase